MNTTLAGPRRPQARRAGYALLAALAVVAVVAGWLISARITDEHSFVPAVVVTNPTLYQVEVDVSGRERDGWLRLGSVRRESEQTMHDVIDKGEQWVFRFRYGGQEAGELVLSRDELRARDWRVTIPPEVGDRLRQSGASPSAR